jgi:hypothetical protein
MLPEGSTLPALLVIRGDEPLALGEAVEAAANSWVEAKVWQLLEARDDVV